MTKVFEYKAGSLVDKVGKQVGQAFDIINKRSEIGQAIETKGEDTSYINFPTFDRTDLRSWSCWIKFNKIDLITAVAFILVGSKMALGTSINGGFMLYSIRGSGYSQRKSNYSFKPRIWYQLVCNYDETGVPSLYINTIESTYDNIGVFSATNDSLYIGKRNTGNAKSVQIAKLCFYTHELTEEERLADYKEFLQSQPTEKPVRGFELVKPTDLSYQKDRGLLAAYNFIRNGDTLVDISGNGNNGTITDGVIQGKEGLVFNGIDSTIPTTLTSNADFVNGYTILARFNMRSTGGVGGVGGRIIDKSTSTSGAGGFYITTRSIENVFAYNDGDNSVAIHLNTDVVKFNVDTTLAFTMTSAGALAFYVNGVAEGTGNRAYNYTTTNPLTIGNRSTAQNRGFDGEFKDLKIYSRVLSLQEIKDYHNSFIKPVILEDWSGSAVGDVI